MNVLWIKSSLSGDNSQSNQLAEHLISELQRSNETVDVVVRDLAANPVPHLDGFRMGAMFSAPEERSEAQQRVLDEADELLNEVKAADLIMIGLPMYNFNISSQLKAWFDHLARAGVTFKYTEQGPVGLLEDKPVYLLATRGGLYAEAGQDFQIGFVKQFLSFIGLNDVREVLAEGLALDDHRQESLEKAKEALVS